MNPDPDTPRVPLTAEDPYLKQLQMMAESDPELEAWLENTVFSNPENPPEPAGSTAAPASAVAAQPAGKR